MGGTLYNVNYLAWLPDTQAGEAWHRLNFISIPSDSGESGPRSIGETMLLRGKQWQTRQDGARSQTALTAS